MLFKKRSVYRTESKKDLRQASRLAILVFLRSGNVQLSGELSKVNLPNLLQLVRTGALTGKFSFQQGARYAVLLVADGIPVHAELEGIDGMDALMELFLWTSGSFAFQEEEVAERRRSIVDDEPDATFEQILRDGLAYAKSTRLLADLGVTPATVLAETGTAISVAAQITSRPGLENLDGRRSLEECLGHLDLSRREFVTTVASWLSDGLAELAGAGEQSSREGMALPSWVVARLKQDNTDINQAIIDMVIWVDRVKCWMYQTDAELYEVVKELEQITGINLSAEYESDDENESETEGSQEAFLPPSDPDSSPAGEIGQSRSNPVSLSGLGMGNRIPGLFGPRTRFFVVDADKNQPEKKDKPDHS